MRCCESRRAHYAFSLLALACSTAATPHATPASTPDISPAAPSPPAPAPRPSLPLPPRPDSTTDGAFLLAGVKLLSLAEANGWRVSQKRPGAAGDEARGTDGDKARPATESSSAGANQLTRTHDDDNGDAAAGDDGGTAAWLLAGLELATMAQAKMWQLSTDVGSSRVVLKTAASAGADTDDGGAREGMDGDDDSLG